MNKLRNDCSRLLLKPFTGHFAFFLMLQIRIVYLLEGFLAILQLCEDILATVAKFCPSQLLAAAKSPTRDKVFKNVRR